MRATNNKDVNVIYAEKGEEEWREVVGDRLE